MVPDCRRGLPAGAAPGPARRLAPRPGRPRAAPCRALADAPPSRTDPGGRRRPPPPPPGLPAAHRAAVLARAAALAEAGRDWHGPFPAAPHALSLDLFAPGDIRPVWERNRWAELPLLAQAARLEPAGGWSAPRRRLPGGLGGGQPGLPRAELGLRRRRRRCGRCTSPWRWRCSGRRRRRARGAAGAAWPADRRHPGLCPGAGQQPRHLRARRAAGLRPAAAGRRLGRHRRGPAGRRPPPADRAPTAASPSSPPAITGCCWTCWRWPNGCAAGTGCPPPAAAGRRSAGCTGWWTPPPAPCRGSATRMAPPSPTCRWPARPMPGRAWSGPPGCWPAAGDRARPRLRLARPGRRRRPLPPPEPAWAARRAARLAGRPGARRAPHRPAALPPRPCRPAALRPLGRAAQPAAGWRHRRLQPLASRRLPATAGHNTVEFDGRGPDAGASPASCFARWPRGGPLPDGGWLRDHRGNRHERRVRVAGRLLAGRGPPRRPLAARGAALAARPGALAADRRGRLEGPFARLRIAADGPLTLGAGGWARKAWPMASALRCRCWSPGSDRPVRRLVTLVVLPD